MEHDEAPPPDRAAEGLLASDDQFLSLLQRQASAEAREMGSPEVTLDLIFLVFVRRFARFGYFNYGPITIDVRLIDAIVHRTHEHGSGGAAPVYSDDFVRFSHTLMSEVRRSGHRRIDELHFLLAFMHTKEGLPPRVFGELGVTPDQAEQFARSGRMPDDPERLYSPEEAAEYLGVHVQTVRAWIRSGRLRASRLAGQRALRIAAPDLRSVLEPVEPGDV
jgi:excisionase family DNA binding protein